MSEAADTQEAVWLLLDETSAPELSAALARALAARRGAALRALFLEDEALLRMASLPGVGRVVMGRAAPEPFAPATVEEEWRALARRARAELERQAARAGVALRFEVRRAARGQAVQQACERAEAVLLTGGTPARASWAPLPARGPRWERAPAVHVVLEGTAADQRALSLAQQLARLFHERAAAAADAETRGLVGAPRSVELWRTPAALRPETAAPPGDAARLHRLAAGPEGEAALRAALRSQPEGLCVVPAGGAVTSALLRPDAPLPCTLVVAR